VNCIHGFSKTFRTWLHIVPIQRILTIPTTFAVEPKTKNLSEFKAVPLA
jgi:hypothetical protein